MSDRESARIPRSTYRLQLNPRFDFRRAAEIVSYLDELGVSDVYASPVFAARSGSPHGYDVIHHARLNPELGGEEEFGRLAALLREHGMGLILDVVPNHMCISDPGNEWWMDVLENGPSSPYARFFDIDWRPPKAELADKVLLPFLGEQYGRVLENQEIQVRYAGGAFHIESGSLRLPVAPGTWQLILQPALEDLRVRLGPDVPHLQELESILTGLRNLPPRTETQAERIRERIREKEILKRRLAALVDASPELRSVFARTLSELNGVRGRPRSFDRLEALLAEQSYRLCFWRVAADEINYRRFSDVNELAAIRVEDPDVFQEVHALAFELIRRGWATGLRIDHVDGLHDPQRYLEDLRAARPDAYLLVEKILLGSERLRERWPVHGTTGYDFLSLLNGLFVRPEGLERLRLACAEFIGQSREFADVVNAAKKFVMHLSLSSELHVLACRLDRISEQHRWSRDFTLESQRFALREVIACFPVYRSYVRAPEGEVSDEDRRHVLHAIREAKRRNPAADASLFDFIASVLLLQDPDGLTDAQRSERREFVMRFQQLTGNFTAKGLEDTAFYRHFPLASLNEVGGGAGSGTTTIEEFHAANRRRLECWPHSMLATATHDTKRGEDTRARLNVLSEIPEEWRQAVLRWREMNAPRRPSIEGVSVPDPNDEYLLYQTLVGSWPLDTDAGYAGRIEAYMIKAMREAKVHTSWVNPNEEYERAVVGFIRDILKLAPDNLFLRDFAAFQGKVAQGGILNSLAQVVLKAASPGVPDFYQGSELWDLSLVDPDNRRPVDFERRRSMLRALATASAVELLRAPHDGRIKMFVTWRALELRRRHERLFREGGYVPLQVEGPRAGHVAAFAREFGTEACVAAAGVSLVSLGATLRPPVGAPGWADTLLKLPAGRYRDTFTGAELRADRGRIEMARVLSTLPVALLERLE